MAIKHGVFVYENDTALTAPILADNAVQVVVGAAPVWMLDDPDAVTNVPILCNSATEAMEKLGYVDDFAKYGLCQTMYLTANVMPVGPVVYINILDVNAGMKTSDSMTVDDDNIPSVIVVTDSAGAIKSSIKVSRPIATETAQETVYTAGSDYTVEYMSDGNFKLNILSTGRIHSGAGQNLVISYSRVNYTAGATEAAVIGSYNATTGKSTGIQLIDSVYPKLGVVPGILLAPGFSHLPAVGVALSAKASSISGVFKAIAVLDINTATAKTYTQVKTVKEQSGFTSPFCYPVWLSYKVGDYIFDGSAVAAAAMAYNDARNGNIPSRTPSNKLIGVSGTCLADGTEVILTQDQATIVNSYGVATAINMSGWRLWGSYTGAYPTTTDVKDMWLPVRRMFNWQANTFILTYFSKVDDPLNHILIESVVDSENIRCAAYTPDVWAGAEIQYLRSDNPITDVLAGKIVFRQKIAPYTPAQEIDNILSYDTSMLANSLAGLAG